MELQQQSPVPRRVRYRRGEVGESRRSVHLAVDDGDAMLVSVCGQVFTPERMEDVVGGMPCMACAQRLALASQGMEPNDPIDEHGQQGLSL